jgi:hypothetical protein
MSLLGAIVVELQEALFALRKHRASLFCNSVQICIRTDIPAQEVAAVNANKIVKNPKLLNTNNRCDAEMPAPHKESLQGMGVAGYVNPVCHIVYADTNRVKLPHAPVLLDLCDVGLSINDIL